MRNRYKGICSECGKEVLPKEGRWRRFPKPSIINAQDFTGLRCLPCSETKLPPSKCARRNKRRRERALL